MKTKPKPAPRIAQNMSQAESLFGVPKAIQKLAKASGCSAFRGQRIHEKDLLEWVAANPEAIAADGERRNKTDRDADLKRERLELIIAGLKLKLRRDKEELIDRAFVRESWALAAAVISDEAKLLLDKASYRIFCERCQARLKETPLPDYPED
jgi:hypothetical protein